MKRIVALIIFTASLASCLGGAVYSDAYTSYATFEYNNYQDIFGSDSLYVEATYNKEGFAWMNYLAFGHKLNSESAEFEGGFLLSCLSVPESENTEHLDNNLYRANQIYTAPKRNTYVVFSKTESMPKKHFWFNYQQGEIKGTCAPQFVLVNNSVEVIRSLQEGFKDGDVMILKATGYLGDKSTGEAQVRLAEFTSAKDSIVTSWTLFKLDALGQVDEIKFDFVMPEGCQIPKVVCMDDFTASLSFSSEN